MIREEMIEKAANGVGPSTVPYPLPPGYAAFVLLCFVGGVVAFGLLGYWFIRWWLR